MDRHDDLAVALTPLIDVLERLGVAWYVGGAAASTVHGRFRATNDVDPELHSGCGFGKVPQQTGGAHSSRS